MAFTKPPACYRVNSNHSIREFPPSGLGLDRSFGGRIATFDDTAPGGGRGRVSRFVRYSILYPGVWFTGPVPRPNAEKNWNPGLSRVTAQGRVEDNVPEVADYERDIQLRYLIHSQRRVVVEVAPLIVTVVVIYRSSDFKRKCECASQLKRPAPKTTTWSSPPAMATFLKKWRN